MRDRLTKIRKKRDRLRQKKKLHEAVTLQHQICLVEEEKADEWLLLAALAQEGKHVDLEILARFTAAKLQHAEPETWLNLSSMALSAGFVEDAVEAKFRAADACAVRGECRHAIELCDEVLSVKPEHAAARRIRQIMAKKLTRYHQQDSPPPLQTELARPPNDNDPKEKIDGSGALGGSGLLTNPLGEGANDSGAQPGLEIGEDGKNIAIRREARQAPWVTGKANGEGGEGKVDLCAERFVCAPQKWPTVLDWHCLAFVGDLRMVDDEVLAFTETVSQAAGELICIQGKPGHLLYCLESGTAKISRERGMIQDFGTVPAGNFFGEGGAIAGLPNTTNVLALEPCVLRIIRRQTLRLFLAQRTKNVEAIVNSLRSWYLETAIRICPLFSHLEKERWIELTREEHWSTFQPGECLARQGQSTKLYVVLSGLARVSLERRDANMTLGYLCSGDLIGEITPSPVSVHAESMVFAIVVDRPVIDLLSNDGQAALEERIMACTDVLNTLRKEQQQPG